MGKRNTNKENITYRFRMYPSGDVQYRHLAMHFGAARWMYNRLLDDRITAYDMFGITLHNTPADYKDVSEYAWLKEMDSLVLCNAQQHHDKAWEKFFKGGAGFPNFKSKKSRQSFTTNVSSTGAANVRFDEAQGLLKIPKCKECFYLRGHRKVRPGGTLKSVTISKEPDGRYYASLLYEYPEGTTTTPYTHSPENQGARAVGLDMSLSSLYVDSNGCVADFPRFYRQAEAGLAKEQRVLSHMEKGSRHYERQKHKVARLHGRVARTRRDFLEKEAMYLVRTYDIICIEDLDMKAMGQSLKLGKSVHDAGWGMFVKILERKCRRYGKALVKVDKWFASSKTCCKCGHKHTGLKLNDRLYVCPECGSVIDRDWQAAINIKQEGLRILNESYAQTA